jgi:hypothetical protein
MSGYTKRMMEIAAEWLVANPDPGSPFLTVPGLIKNGGSKDAAVNLARYERMAKQVPAIAPYVEELRSAVKARDEQLGKLHESEVELEDCLSKAPTPGHDKYDADDRHHADIGRWCLTWARQGYNVFDLSPDFTAAILLTDAREMDISDVRLPFAGMLLMISDGFAQGAEGSSYTKIHVTEVPRSHRSMLGAGEKLFDLLKDLPLAESSAIMQVLKDKPPTNRSLITDDPSDTVIHIYASDGTRVLETWIERKNLTWDAFDDLPDTVTEDADKQARHALRQIVFGAIAYTNAVEGSMEERFPETKKPSSSPKQRAKHWAIGRTIKIDPQLVRAVRLGSREVSFRLKHRHIVRGHYRNQAHGPARALRTKKWIQPFWKGPEEGAALVHTYKLDETNS